MNLVEVYQQNLSKWDDRYLRLAKYVSHWSKDPSTCVGAVIVSTDNRVMSMGYNGFPRGVEDREDRYNDRPTKYAFVAHAERNALDNFDSSTRGCTMYVTLQPCPECAKSIIQRGVKRVVYKYNPERENLSNFMNYTLAMFNEAGVEIVQVIEG